MRLGRVFVLAIGLILLRLSPAAAHAVLTQSTPSNDQLVVGADLSVELHFNCRIDVRHSRLTLIKSGDENRAVALHDSAPSNMLKADLKSLEQGAYQLHWQVLSVDGHITRGDIFFRASR
jgi:methionine-rich copper-binding protein CopC